MCVSMCHHPPPLLLYVSWGLALATRSREREKQFCDHLILRSFIILQITVEKVLQKLYGGDRKAFLGRGKENVSEHWSFGQHDNSKSVWQNIANCQNILQQYHGTWGHLTRLTVRQVWSSERPVDKFSLCEGNVHLVSLTASHTPPALPIQKPVD